MTGRTETCGHDRSYVQVCEISLVCRVKYGAAKNSSASDRIFSEKVVLFLSNVKALAELLREVSDVSRGC